MKKALGFRPGQKAPSEMPSLPLMIPKSLPLATQFSICKRRRRRCYNPTTRTEDVGLQATVLPRPLRKYPEPAHR